MQSPCFKRILFCFISLCFAIQAHAGFDEGLAAFNSGNFKEAYEEWIPLAERGDARSQGLVGFLFYFGLGTAIDYQKAAIWFQKSAKQDDAIGQTGLGNMYRFGRGGLPKKIDKAFYWLEKAVAQNEPWAQKALAIMLASKKGGPRSSTLIKEYLQKSLDAYMRDAREGKVDAQAQVALSYVVQSYMYETSWDKAQVLQWLKNSAEHGHPLAQFLMGVAYQFGNLLPHDDQQATFWVRKAADQGEPSGQRMLGDFYIKGKGVPKDERRGFILIMQAAKQGHPGAMYSLGECYERGIGVERNRDLALEWYRKAVAHDFDKANEKIRELQDGGVH